MNLVERGSDNERTPLPSLSLEQPASQTPRYPSLPYPSKPPIPGQPKPTPHPSIQASKKNAKRCDHHHQRTPPPLHHPEKKRKSQHHTPPPRNPPLPPTHTPSSLPALNRRPTSISR